MILASVGLVALLGALSVARWRNVREQAIRWELYGLRDELRLLAIDDVEVRNTYAFSELDRNITSLAANLEDFSLWAVLPVMFRPRFKPQADDRHRRLMQQLERPENKAMLEIYFRSAGLIAKHIVLRHMVVSTLAAVTVLGGIEAWRGARWLSQRALSGLSRGEITFETPMPGMRHAA